MATNLAGWPLRGEIPSRSHMVLWSSGHIKLWDKLKMLPLNFYKTCCYQGSAVGSGGTCSHEFLKNIYQKTSFFKVLPDKFIKN